MGRRKKNALRLLPNLSGNKSRIHYLVRLYKFNQKTTPIEPILVVGEYHFDSGRFGFDFGNIGTLACSNGLYPIPAENLLLAFLPSCQLF